MFCAIIFAICFIGFIGLAIYFAVVGDPRRMSMGVDGNKQVCGQFGTKTENYPYLLLSPMDVP